jgi:hypothetical protein
LAEAGLERPADYPGKARLSTASDAKSDALSSGLAIFDDPDLACLVAAWPNLHDKLKLTIIRLAAS